LFKLIDVTIGLRVSAEEELEGLDFAEHGGNAYPDFEISHAGGMGAIGGHGLLKAEAASNTMLRKPVEQA
jgi:Amt family ammonium transporter